MKESLLLPILRSQTQGDLLALLFLNPDEQYTLTEAARAIAVSVPGLHHEAVRLIDAGLIKEHRQGRNRIIQAQLQSRIASALTDLLALTYGPMPVLEREFKGVRGIEHVYIFGSWAARYKGNPGPIPNDIDVLVIGSTQLDLLDAISDRAEITLKRDINIKRVSAKDWKQGSPFISTFKKNPHVELRII